MPSSPSTDAEGSPSLQERTVPGLHAVVFARLRVHRPPPATVLDLGAGTGAWANRLLEAGYTVTAIERPDGGYVGSAPLVPADLNTDFVGSLAGKRFDIVSCLEVIEHLENPTQLLRSIRSLLAPDGIALITTPNFESTAGRLRFLWTGELRGFGRDSRFNEPTHINPIHTFMLERAVASARLKIIEAGHDRARASGSRCPFRFAARILDPILRGTRGGDTHIVFLGAL
jgi:2-polyprenyl-3-methyl-5-hydroxy-6-metoxy-1,4-benzoquinol methylase